MCVFYLVPTARVRIRTHTDGASASMPSLTKLNKIHTKQTSVKQTCYN